MKTQLLKLTSGLALLGVVASAPAQNLINNGNFELGNTDFTSSYFNGTGFYEDLTEPGFLFVGTNPGPANDWFVNGTSSPVSGFTDHTLGTGTGKMLMVNGDSSPTAVVWQYASSVSVLAGQAYRFSADIANINAWTTSDQMPALTFQLSLDNGLNWQTLATSADPVDPATWYLTGMDGTFASDASVELRLMNAQASLSGNDFAIDDIYFGTANGAPDAETTPYNAENSMSFTGIQPAPEPATLALAGLGGLGMLWQLRRRK